jgi:septal ring factor EnvC (AmiA/AmiB activator)
MTSEDIASLRDFLATEFARMDSRSAEIHARFEAVDARFEAIDARFSRVEDRLTAIEARLTRIEARQDAMEARLDAMEGRLARVEILHEETRADLRRVVEAVVAVNERLDRELGGIHVRFDRFELDFGTVQLAHEARITALERHGRKGGRRG